MSNQHLYGQAGRVRYMKSEAKGLKESYQWQAKAQRPNTPLKGNLDIKIYLYFKDHRKRDWDNWHKLSMDALNGIIWEDDSQIKRATVEVNIDADNPRIEIVVVPLDTELRG